MTIRAASYGLFTAMLLAASAVGAHAVEPMAPVRQQVFTCAPSARALQRVATAAPDQCCSPNSHCVEFLSTTTVDHPSKANRS